MISGEHFFNSKTDKNPNQVLKSTLKILSKRLPSPNPVLLNGLFYFCILVIYWTSRLHSFLITCSDPEGHIWCDICLFHQQKYTLYKVYTAWQPSHFDPCTCSRQTYPQALGVLHGNSAILFFRCLTFLEISWNVIQVVVKTYFERWKEQIGFFVLNNILAHLQVWMLHKKPGFDAHCRLLLFLSFNTKLADLPE